MMANKIDFKVAIKVRPLLSKEKNLKSFWRVVNNSIQLIDSQSEPNFFDHVFNQDANNETVFKYIAKDIVHKSIQGMNGTIFAYGQTASGKTYTMMGNSENPGVMVLTAREIFRLIEGITDRKFLLRCGYIEIYNERIYDLLNKKNTDLKIHETPTGLINVNCDEMIITCEEDFLKYLCMGNQERTTGETNMNERSSRSHAIFRVIIESRKLGQDVDDTVTQSVLNLVDLAGSERADQTGARGARLKEGGHINKSLHFLSNVIKSLSENEDDKFISFRDSKLTRILQTSLGGNSLTSIVCTVNPTAVEETQSTLSFARRAKTIKTKPTVNEIVSEATMMKRLELEIKTLKSQLEVERNKNENQLTVGQLEHRLKCELIKIIGSKSAHEMQMADDKRRRTWCSTTAPFNPPKMRLEPKTAPKTLAGNSTVSVPSMFDKGRVFVASPITESSEETMISTPGELLSHNQTSVPESRLSLPLVEIKSQMSESQELVEFTTIEKELNVKPDLQLEATLKLEAVTKRLTELEKERREQMEQILELQLSYAESNDKCQNLEAQIEKLLTNNESLTVQIDTLEEEHRKNMMRKSELEKENQLLSDVEFELQCHKEKTALREKDLLALIDEKDIKLKKLEETLRINFQQKLNFPNGQHDYGEVHENGEITTNGKPCEEDIKKEQKYANGNVNFEQIMKDFKSFESNLMSVMSEEIIVEPLLNDLTIQLKNLYEALNRQPNDQQSVEKGEEIVKVESNDLELKSLQDELKTLQSEYDDLSTQLMDQVDENDIKTKRINALEKEIAELKESFQEESKKFNMMSTVNFDALEDKRVEFFDLLKTVQEIELQTEKDEMLCFVHKVASDPTGIPYKLIIQNMEQVIPVEGGSAEDASELKGSINKISYVFTQMQPPLESFEMLQNRFAMLMSANDMLTEERKSMLETVQYLQEQMLKLTADIIEKSSEPDCKELVQEIEKEVSILCEDFQNRMSFMDTTIHNITTERFDTGSVIEQLKLDLKSANEAISAINMELQAEKDNFAALYEKHKLCPAAEELVKHIIEQMEFLQIPVATKIEYVEKNTKELLQLVRQAFEKLICTLESTQAEFENCKLTLKSAEESIAQLEAERESAKRAFNEEEECLEKVKELLAEEKLRSADLRDQMNNLLSNELDLKTEIAQLKAHIEELINELEKRKLIGDQMQVDYESAMQGIENLTSELQAKQQNQELQTLQNYIDTLRRGQEKLKTQGGQSIRLQAIIDTLQQVLVNAQIKIENLKQEKVNQLQQENTEAKLDMVDNDGSGITLRHSMGLLKDTGRLSDNENIEPPSLESKNNNEDVDGLLMRLKALDEQVSTQNVKLTILENNNDQYKLELTTAQQTIHELQAENTNLTNLFAQQEKEIDLLNGKLVEIQPLLEKQKEELKNSESKNTFQAVQLIKAEETINYLEVEHRNLRDQLKHQKEVNESLTLKLTNTEEMLQKQKEEIIKSEQDQQNLIAARQKIDKMESELVQIADKFTQLQKENDELVQKLASAEENLERQTEQLFKQQQQLQKENYQFIQTLAEVDEILKEKNDEMTSLENENKTLQLRLTTVNHAVDQVEKERCELLKSHDLLNGKLNELMSNKVELLERLDGQIMQLSKEREKISELELERSNLSKKLDHLETERDLLNQNLSIANEKLRKQENEMKLLELNEEKAQEKITNLEAERKKLKEEIEINSQSFSNIMELLEQHEVIVARSNNQQLRLSMATQKIAEMKMKNKQMTEQIIQLKIEINELNQKLLAVDVIGEQHKAIQTFGDKARQLTSNLFAEIDSKIQTVIDQQKKDQKIFELEAYKELHQDFQAYVDDLLKANITIEDLQKSRELLNHIKAAVYRLNAPAAEEAEIEKKFTVTILISYSKTKWEFMLSSISDKVIEDIEQFSEALERSLATNKILYRQLNENKSKVKCLQEEVKNLTKTVMEKTHIGANIAIQSEVWRESVTEFKNMLKNEEIKVASYATKIAKMEKKENCYAVQLEHLKLVNEMYKAKLKDSEDEYNNLYFVFESQRKKFKTQMLITQETLDLAKEIQQKNAMMENQLWESQDKCSEYEASIKFMKEYLCHKNNIICEQAKLIKNLQEAHAPLSTNDPDKNFEVSVPSSRPEVAITDSFQMERSRSLLDIFDSTEPLIPHRKEHRCNTSKEAEAANVRKNRRQSIYDQHRRASASFGFFDAECQTEPIECGCTQLKTELEECKVKSVIYESQIASLNLKLRHHPLRTENATLLSRIKEHKDKYTAEIQRLKLHLFHLEQQKQNLVNNGTQTPTIPPKFVENNFTQTDSYVDKNYDYLLEKYEKTVEICRHRFQLIKTLEQKLELDKVVIPENSTEMTPTEIDALKIQCETHREEFLVLQRKYEQAKKALLVRREEIIKLKNELNKTEKVTEQKNY